MKEINRILTALILIVFSISAKEGADQYNLGAPDFMAGALPPVGHYLLTYTGHYSGELRDISGKKVNNVSIDASFQTFRYVYIPNIKVFGGQLAFHSILPIVNQTFRTPERTQKTTGIGDLIVSPLSVGWNFGKLKIVGALDLYIPTGK